MGHLKLAMLGPWEATVDGTPVRLPASSMARALLAYLAAEGDFPQPRQILGALLWPEHPDRDALAHLRRTLFDLRQALDDDPQYPFLLATRETIGLNPAADVALDVLTFTQALGAASAPSASPLDPEAMARLEEAVTLYRGGFLEGLAVDSVPFEEWALLKREQLHWQALEALWLLAEAYEARGKYGQAARYARRQLELQPWQEEAHRQLMRALALAGQRSAALAQYETCAERLEAELGVAPADETVALHQAIRDGTLTRPAARPPSGVVAPPITPRPFTPAVFVSREAELAKLKGFLETALTVQGQVAFVSGQAGSGKTALLAQFSQQAMAHYPELVVAGGNCNAQAGIGDPYLPFREILQLLSGDIEARRAGGGLSPEHARRLWALLPTTARALLAHGPDLVGTFVPGEPLLHRLQAFALDGTARWERLEKLARRPPGADRTLASQTDLFDQATQVLQVVAAQHPLLLLLDDLQWADQGTLGLLFHLGRRLGGGRVLIVGAYRAATVALGAPSSATSEGAGPAERHPLEPVVHEFGRDWGDIGVDLDRADGRAFVEAFLDTEPNLLGAAFRKTLYQHTWGNPLFTIELLRGLQERGDLVRDEAGRWEAGPALQWERLPARVEAVIAERFDRLPAECKRLLQVASVEGNEFTAEVVAGATGLGLSRVIYHLSETLSKQHRLVRPARLLHREPGGQPLSCYRFAHILFQRYVYDQLDEVARVHLHHSVAETLETLRPEGEVGAELGVQDPTAPLRLARHWELAGMPLQAARALHEAGRLAMGLSAFREALNRFDHGLALLAEEPPSAGRTEIQRVLEVARLAPQRNLDGLSGAMFEDALARAKKAWAGDAQGRPMFEMLAAEADDLSARGQYEAALALATRIHDEAAQRGEESFLAVAHWRMGAIHSALGNLHEGERHFEWLLTWLTREKWTALRSLIAQDYTASCLAFSAVNQWFLGYPETALARATEAMTGAVARGETYGQAFAFGIGAAALFLVRVDDATMEPRVEYLHRLAREEGFRVWQMYADAFMGRLIALRGDRDRLAGVRRIQTAIAEWRGAGFVPDTDILTTVLADTCLTAAGRLGPSDQAAREDLLSAGLAAIGTMLGPENVPCGRHWAAELHRLRGDLLLARDGLAASEEALQSYQTAMSRARENGLLPVELRAATSLVRLRQRQGDACAAELAEARHCLREVYGRFTEGLAFPDLQEAAALLDTLS